MPLRALALNCTLSPSPAESSTDRLLGEVLDALAGHGVEHESVRVVDHDEIIVNGQQRVQAYNPDTGAELWSCGGMGYEVIPTPVGGYGMVFCSSGRAGPTLAIRPLMWTLPS